MDFRLGAIPFRVEVLEDRQAESPHTGAPVRILRVQFTVTEANHAIVTDRLQALNRGGLFAGEPDSANETEWRLTNSSYSYQADSQRRIYTYTWELQEVEHFSTTTLRIGSLELTPYAYAEDDAQAGRIEIRARASVNQEQLERIHGLHATHQAVTVVREGVTSTPREMDLQSYAWSATPDGVKVEVQLVDLQPSDDEPGRRPAFAPLGLESPNVRESISYRSEAFEELLSILRQKGILTEAEAARLTNIAPERVQRRLLRWYQVGDVDYWSI